jgi:Lrp/AsnC family transcriptional regulator for asnA, asnC and gidA
LTKKFTRLDGRCPHSSDRHKIGISERQFISVCKLEQSGVISGSKFTVNKVLGYNTMAFVGVYLDKAARNAEAVRDLKKILKF